MSVSPLQKVAAMQGGPCLTDADAALQAIAAGLGATAGSTPCCSAPGYRYAPRALPELPLAQSSLALEQSQLPPSPSSLTLFSCRYATGCRCARRALAALQAIAAGLGATAGSPCRNRRWPCVAAVRRVTAMRRGPCRSCPRRNRRWPWSLVGSTRRNRRWPFCLPLYGGLPLCAEGLAGAALGAIVAGLGASSAPPVVIVAGLFACRYAAGHRYAPRALPELPSAQSSLALDPRRLHPS